MKDPRNQIIDFLNKSRIKFVEIEHKPVFTSEEAAKVRGVPMSWGMKTLLLRSSKQKQFFLVVLPGDKKPDSSKVRRLLGLKGLRFASAAEVKEIMGCEIGACYPFGNLPGLPTYADGCLAKNKKVCFNPGSHAHSYRNGVVRFLLLG
jgi:Ala-tRNA(Pro) deacylase